MCPLTAEELALALIRGWFQVARVWRGNAAMEGHNDFLVGELRWCRVAIAYLRGPRSRHWTSQWSRREEEGKTW
mgnify:CR=1 FL=1